MPGFADLEYSIVEPRLTSCRTHPGVAFTQGNAPTVLVIFQEFPASIIEEHGRQALEAIETMSGKPVPGQVWRKLKSIVTASGDGSGGGAQIAEDRVALLMDQYRRMLRFLGGKGCLVNSVHAEVEQIRLAHAGARFHINHRMLERNRLSCNEVLERRRLLVWTTPSKYTQR